MVKVGFVILNYINYEETIRCVNSVLEQEDVEVSVVIVDNGSGNESVMRLKQEYSDFSDVDIIYSATNLGYAQGNNLGIKHLKDKGCEFIWIANSDTIFTEKYISKNCVDAYVENIGLINPTSYKLDGTKNTRIFYKKKFLYLRLLKHFAVEWVYAKVLKKSKKAEGYFVEDGDTIIDYTKSGIHTVHEDQYVVTGSVFLLTKDFLKYYDGLFPKTFLYGEEYATIVLLHKASLKTSEVDTGMVLHKHQASTPPDKNLTKCYLMDSLAEITKLIFMGTGKVVRKY